MTIQIRNVEGECFEATNGDFLLRAGSCDDKNKVESNISPGELFIVSLGMCTSTYITRFCKRHKLEHEDLKMKLDYESGQEPPKVKEVDITINLPVSEKYKSAVLRVAKQCYVKQSIQKRVELNYNIQTD